MDYKTLELHEAVCPTAFEGAMVQSISYLIEQGELEAPHGKKGTPNFVKVGGSVAYVFQVLYNGPGNRKLNIRVFGDSSSELDARVDRLVQATSQLPEPVGNLN